MSIVGQRLDKPVDADRTSLQSLSQCPSLPLVALDAIMWTRVSLMSLLRPGSDSWSNREKRAPSRPTSFMVTSAEMERAQDVRIQNVL